MNQTIPRNLQSEKAAICVLGNSHSAAMKNGWRIVRNEFPWVDLTFFAGPSADWDSLKIDGDRLVPGTAGLHKRFEMSSGRNAIDASFDAYVLCGLDLALSFPLRLWTHQNQRDWNAYPRAVAEAVHDTSSARLLPKLRQITDRPALVIAAPHQPHDYCKSSPLLDDGTAARLRAVFDETCTTMAAAHGARFLEQPRETLAPNGITTRMEFANPPSEDAEDRRHCNGAYGAIVLREAFAVCSSLIAQRQEANAA